LWRLQVYGRAMLGISSLWIQPLRCLMISIGFEASVCGCFTIPYTRCLYLLHFRVYRFLVLKLIHIWKLLRFYHLEEFLLLFSVGTLERFNSWCIVVFCIVFFFASLLVNMLLFSLDGGTWKFERCLFVVVICFGASLLFCLELILFAAFNNFLLPLSY
jgi:hypothetical protein